MYKNNTKIVCTLGPASNSITEISRLVQAGMDIARLNFSHGTYEEHLSIIKNVRTVEKRFKKTVTILQDLQGPKLRVGEMKEPIQAKRGDKIVLPLQHHITKDLRKGNTVFVNDGLIELRIEKVEKGKVSCRVIAGGLIKARMGVNVPDAKISIPAITEKDKKDLAFGLKNDVDFVALSFVRTPKDIQHLKKLIAQHKKSTPVIAKIERPEALKNLEEIIKEADGVMVARGDMGVNLPPEQVPIYQKKIISLANKYAKPVITATQVLNSMILNPVATRAEISDAANAVFDHSDCIMLSNETSIGKYPFKAASTLSRVINAVENELKKHKELLASVVATRKISPVDSYCLSACELALDSNAKTLAVFTNSGYTAQQVAKYRIAIPIIVFTPHEKTARELSLTWGINQVFIDKKYAKKENRSHAILETLKKNKLIKKGEKILVLSDASTQEKIISTYTI